MQRVSVNYRKLNAITVRDPYPIPRMDKCIDSLRSAKIFSTLDCNSGHRQIPIAEKDRDEAAFVCHSGLYCFRRMPFGLTNAPDFSAAHCISCCLHTNGRHVSHIWTRPFIFPMTLKTISVTSERYWRYSKELASRFNYQGASFTETV